MRKKSYCEEIEFAWFIFSHFEKKICMEFFVILPSKSEIFGQNVKISQKIEKNEKNKCAELVQRCYFGLCAKYQRVPRARSVPFIIFQKCPFSCDQLP